VLFVFVVMMLNLGETAVEQEHRWLHPSMWAGPTILLLILLVEVIYMLAGGGSRPGGTGIVGAKQVALVLFGPYLLGVELASMLLLAGLVGAFHLGRRANRADG
jgi:NADH-quinone oxidoreductase subunit J